MKKEKEEKEAGILFGMKCTLSQSIFLLVKLAFNSLFGKNFSSSALLDDFDWPEQDSTKDRTLQRSLSSSLIAKYNELY